MAQLKLVETENKTHKPDAALVDKAEAAFKALAELPLEKRVETINAIRTSLAEHSPFKKEPVDCVIWVPGEKVTANDYNPNSVAPPEMKLLEQSIMADGYTQPIVAWDRETRYEVVDGFHRNRVGKESQTVNARVKGYLPLAVIRTDREGRNDRIASTIRHNRARGKHQVQAMSDIVIELKRRNWTNEKISRELGMDQDEILRLCQITGLSEIFSDQEFSKAWDVEGHIEVEDFEELSDAEEDIDEEVRSMRTVNTSDEGRIFHTWEDWECHKAGFYANSHTELKAAEGKEQYRNFLSNLSEFEQALNGVITEWKHSCEHYLTNVSMNRIAWLGQAAACYGRGLPAVFRGGFSLLTDDEQERANEVALVYLNKWLEANGRDPVTMEEAMPTRQSDIY
jgi:ParB-like chromosome segregation protein Spo0J